jgi:hypothetical protein
MELMISFVINILCNFTLGLIINYVYDKLKNHSASTKTKSGIMLEIKIKLKK